MRRPPRAFMLALALFLTAFVVVLGMAFLGSRAQRYEGAVRALANARALALAQAGMEDARVKLAKDQNFPPPSGPDQPIYAYQERFTDVGSATVVGGYNVTIDKTYVEPPYSIIIVRATGLLGNVTSPAAVATIRAELDVSPVDRSTNAPPNPNLFQFITWSEEGL